MVHAEKAFRVIAIMSIIMAVAACGTNKPKKAGDVQNRGGQQQNLGTGGDQNANGANGGGAGNGGEGAEAGAGAGQDAAASEGIVSTQPVVEALTETLTVTDIGSINVVSAQDESLVEEADLVAGSYKLAKVQTALRTTQDDRISSVEISHTLAVAGVFGERADVDAIVITRGDATQTDVLEMEDADFALNLTVSAEAANRITMANNRIYKAKVNEQNRQIIEIVERADATAAGAFGLSTLLSGRRIALNSGAQILDGIRRIDTREIRMQKTAADTIVFTMISQEALVSQITRLEYKKQ